MAAAVASLSTSTSSRNQASPSPAPSSTGPAYDTTAEPAPLVARGVSDDLASLTDQTAGALTDALAARYDVHEVYTHCGLLTLALNPYAQVPDLYGATTQRSFYGVPKHSQRPHVYAVAENAYQALHDGKDNQTIVITGESGSGKTVSCGHIIEYLAARGMAIHALGDKLAHASAVLEAFGNAPTIHNTNSSRYAKVVNIHFGSNAELIGASISTFLLERGRVTDDRPFHVISLLRERQKTGQTPPALEKVYAALTALGITEQEGMWSVLRGVDYLIAGDITKAAASLGVDAQDLTKTLKKRSFKAGTDSFETARSGDELRAAQYGLVRSLYSWVFDWIVARINEALDAPNDRGPTISLVDIFGFESFKSNALAQFLINWANEQLQRQLSKDVLEAQADAYAAEGIDFGAPAVQPSCLDLLSNKPGQPGQTGIAFLLDDQTRRQNLGLGGSDDAFSNSISSECNALYGLVTRRANAHPHEFTVIHYGHDVTYDTRGFLEANSERVDDNLRDVLTRSSTPFVRELVGPNTNVKSAPGRSAFTSIVSSFRKSLDKLNTLLISTNVHYIHCIKSNHQAAPWLLERQSVELQVEATGITQIARFARECGPYLVRREAMSPYLLVLESYADLSDAVKQLSNIVGDADGKAVQLGQTNVFFRAAALSKIEGLLSDKIKVVVALQSCARRTLARRRFEVVLKQARAEARAREEARLLEEARKREEEEARRREEEEIRRQKEEESKRQEEERLRVEEEKKREEEVRRLETAKAKIEAKAEKSKKSKDDNSTPKSVRRVSSRLGQTPTPPPGNRSANLKSPLGSERNPLTPLLNSVDSASRVTPPPRSPSYCPSSYSASGPEKAEPKPDGRLKINGLRASPEPRRISLPYQPTTPTGVRTPGAKELSNAPLYNKGLIHVLVHDLVHASTTYQAAYTAGTLLARTVSWYHDADLRYVPEILTPVLLQTVRNDIGPNPSLHHLWLLAILAHSFRLDAGHRPARALGTVEKELLDLIAKHIYAVSKRVLDLVLPRRTANGNGALGNSVTALLNEVWASLAGLPESIQDVTAESIINRVLQVVIQNILLQEIREEYASYVLGSLQPVFDWRESVNLPPPALETVVSAMLGVLTGLKEPSPGFQLRFDELMEQKHTRHPTNMANTALKALTDHPGVDIQANLDDALRGEDYEHSWHAVEAGADQLSQTPAITQFVTWIKQFTVVI